MKNAFETSGNSPTRNTVPPPADFLVQNEGTIFLLIPRTISAKTWVEQNIGKDNGYQPYWPTVVVEHRYISDIVAGIQNDGLVVRS